MWLRKYFDSLCEGCCERQVVKVLAEAEVVRSRTSVFGIARCSACRVWLTSCRTLFSQREIPIFRVSLRSKTLLIGSTGLILGKKRIIEGALDSELIYMKQEEDHMTSSSTVKTVGKHVY